MRSAIHWVVGLGLAALASAASAEASLQCKMTFTMKGWSFVFRTADGTGTVTCSDGQSFPVKLRIRGAGFTMGKSVIEDGKGDFSGVSDASEVFGSYAAAEAAAGAVKSAGGQLLTKGEVSLALGGTGRGWDLGVSIGRLQIQRP